MTRLAAGSWCPIAVGFLVYAIMVVAAHFAHSSVLLSAGALVMIFISALGNHQRLFTLRVGPPAGWALLCTVPPTLSLIVNPGVFPVEPVIKFDLMFLVFLLIYSWRLTPLNRSSWRWALLAGCLALLFCSVLSGHYFKGEGGERRLSGVFSNPNNLALLGLSLLLFLNDDDPPWRHVLVHAAALGTLAMSGTLGAYLGYSAGMAYRLRQKLTLRRAAIGLVVVAVAAALLSKGQVSELRLVHQYEVARDSLSLSALQAEDVDFGAAAESHGGSATSALWRLTMWWRVIRTYAEGRPYQWFLGRGVGASEAMFGILPHNDYLRLLFETGAVGLIAFLGLVFSAWRGMEARDRYVVPLILVYTLSENNLDNFLCMVLFMFFMASAQPAVRATELVPWNAHARGVAAWAKTMTSPPRGTRRELQ
jgi:hypothetical protein